MQFLAKYGLRVSLKLQYCKDSELIQCQQIRQLFVLSTGPKDVSKNNGLGKEMQINIDHCTLMNYFMGDPLIHS